MEIGITIHLTGHQDTKFSVTTQKTPSLGDYPVLKIEGKYYTNVTIFPSMEQLTDLHEKLGEFLYSKDGGNPQQEMEKEVG